MTIPDPIERGVARYEDWADEFEQPDGRFKCGCGELFKLEDGETLSPNPYATPVCPNCAMAYFNGGNKVSEEVFSENSKKVLKLVADPQ